MEFRIAKNGHGLFRVQCERPIPGDGGIAWQSYDDMMFHSLERAREHLQVVKEEHEDFVAKTTWEPVE